MSRAVENYCKHTDHVCAAVASDIGFARKSLGAVSSRGQQCSYIINFTVLLFLVKNENVQHSVSPLPEIEEAFSVDEVAQEHSRVIVEMYRVVDDRRLDINVLIVLR